MEVVGRLEWPTRRAEVVDGSAYGGAISSPLGSDREERRLIGVINKDVERIEVAPEVGVSTVCARVVSFRFPAVPNDMMEGFCFHDRYG